MRLHQETTAANPIINERPSSLKYLDCFLRMSTIPLSIATVWLTATNKQDNISYGLIQFGDFLAFRYLVCISGICAAYALASAAASWIQSMATKAWLFFVPDQIAAYMMVTSVAAAMEMLYLAYNGDQQVAWSEACFSYSTFCSKMKFALILHFLALCCFFALAVISAYRTFCIFEPPFVSSNEVEEERA